MKIKKIEIEKRAATSNSLSPQEQTAMKSVFMQLKTAAPGIGPLLQNPNNLTFLMKFFEAIGQNDKAISILKNSMTLIKSALEKDQASTTAFLAKI